MDVNAMISNPPTGRAWPSDKLVRAAQSGDLESIAALIEGSHPHVRRFAQSLCVTAQDAEDATQEALIILYRKIGTLRVSAALASWMFRIVRHECIRRWSETRRHLLLPAIDADDAETVASAEDDALMRLEASMVATVIAELPADLRQVLLLRDVYGYGGKLVAKHLGLTVPAMKSRLHRARSALRNGLEGGVRGTH
jgi:RNA polymerase sigma factor (sigma-70 family)